MWTFSTFSYLVIFIGFCVCQENEVIIEEYENNNDGTGNYDFSFKTSDGSQREEIGRFQDDKLVVMGSYQYTAPDGDQYIVTYLADEKGYRPKMSKLIKGPPAGAAFSLAQFSPVSHRSQSIHLPGSLLSGGKRGKASDIGLVQSLEQSSFDLKDFRFYFMSLLSEI